jgi:uncharacterized protein YegL
MSNAGKGRYGDVEEVALRTLTLFFIADVSGSMKGNKIGALNETIKNLIPEIQQIADGNADANIHIAMLKFSTYSEWATDQPVDSKDFKYRYLDAGGLTDLGAACLALNEKLSRKNGFMYTASGAFAPILFLLSDGYPTDDYRSGIAKLKNNKWYKNAIKIAVAIGDGADEDVLAEFTGICKEESVFKVRTPEALSKMIRFIVKTSSEIGSKSQDAGATGTTKQQAVGKQVTEYHANLKTDDEADGDW